MQSQAPEVAEIDTGGHKSEQIVEPLTNYLAARIQKDYKEGNTIIGGMFTSVNRKMERYQSSVRNRKLMHL